MDNRVLIIDDDRDLCALLLEYLETQGFEAQAVHDGAQALEHLRQHHYDVLVLDIMLPGMLGLDVLRNLREFDNTPVLMLTARGEDTDRIVGLEMGADDYLPKPCNPRELAARLRAILRRAGDRREEEEVSELHAGDTHIHMASRAATHAGQPVPLTSAEFNLLCVLLRHAGTVVDKDTLSREGLGRPLSAYDRSVDVHVSKIRRKLAEVGGDNLILSVRGAGYQFVLDDAG
ncbi:response regulator transcription factor [Mangrovimicrobium sediminis]|uniref:Response regulator transcription factor n=1 Tax=Mangrovimicrobium sediminis TaxID=2562682 RepID=A0A4Z0M5U8_9GAMM|nr:response regulator transcription factor [Haliea sp. SAOS-164]TGD74685.1 response regulator transcription factor [Haliea sp. SAOS-164]